MKINILEKPLALAEIECRRETLEAERFDLKKKIQLLFTFSVLSLLFFFVSWAFVMSIHQIDHKSGIALYFLMTPLIASVSGTLVVLLLLTILNDLMAFDFFKKNLSVPAALVPASAIASVLLLAFNHSEGVSKFDEYLTLLAFYNFAVLFAVNYFVMKTLLMDFKYHKVNMLVKELTFLDFTHGDENKCLEIKEWLEDEDICAFRDALVEQGRPQFIRAEYKAMKEHWEGRTDRLRKQQAQEACKEIFLGGIMQGKA